MTFQKGQNNKSEKQIGICQGRRGGKGVPVKNEMGGVTKLFHILLVVSRLQDYIYLLTHIEQYSLKWGILLGANYTSINLILFLKERMLVFPLIPSSLSFSVSFKSCPSPLPPPDFKRMQVMEEAECRKKGWLLPTYWGKTILAALRFQ